MMNKIPFKTLTLFLLILIGNLSLAEENKNSVFASLKGKLIELKDGKAEDAKIKRRTILPACSKKTQMVQGHNQDAA